jgi:hypothetical protein
VVKVRLRARVRNMSRFEGGRFEVRVRRVRTKFRVRD